MLPEAFYLRILLGKGGFVPTYEINKVSPREDSIHWVKYHGCKIGLSLFDGLIVASIDLGDRIISARRKKVGNGFTWHGSPPREADLVKLALVF